MAEQRIFGIPLDEKVVRQLETRENLYSKKTNKTSEELLAMYGNTSWIQLVSGVNTASDPKLVQQAKQRYNYELFHFNRVTETTQRSYDAYIKGSNDLAKDNVLTGGSLYAKTIQSNQGNQQVLKQRSGIDFTGTNEKTFYSNYRDTLGVRPSSGITAMSISTKNRYGTLRTATVSLQCWTIEQLTTLDKLFFRPGYSILLEWGNTYYVDENGNFVDNILTTKSDFLNGKSADEIKQSIETKKATSNYNYDAILGKIVNFSWSYRQDSGYDCTVDIVAAGELIESLEILIPGNVKSVLEQTQTENQSQKLSEYRSTLHQIFTDLRDKNSEKLNTILNNLFKNFKTKLQRPNQQFITLFFSELYKGTSGEKNLNSKQRFRYIRLQDLLDIINYYTFLLSVSGNQLEATPILRFNTQLGRNKFLTFNDHRSINPEVCTIPAISQTFTSFNQTKEALELSRYISKVNGDYDDILNIGININFILQQLDTIANSVRNGDLSKKAVFDFVRSILDAVEQSLGEVNSFDLHLDEPDNWFVIDRNLPILLGKNQYYTLNLIGLKSQVISVDLQTKLSSEISNSLAIAATATNTGAGVVLEGFFKYNEGLYDRIYKDKKPLTLTIREDIESRVNREILPSIASLFRKYTDKTNAQYPKEDFANIFEDFKLYCKFTSELNRIQQRNQGKPVGYPGIIPFTLSLKLNGISGIKIGEAFLINKGILPQTYDNKVGFIITGVEHEISNSDSKWYTNLSAQVFMLPDNEISITGATPRTSPLSTQTQFPGNVTPVLQENPSLVQILNNAGYRSGTVTYELALTIGIIEGWDGTANGGIGTRSYRNNNPGNLDFNEDLRVIDPGVMLEQNPFGANRFAKFTTPELGMTALIERKIRLWSLGRMPITEGNQSLLQQATGQKWTRPNEPTFREFFYTYAPPNENNTEGYILRVVNRLNQSLELQQSIDAITTIQPLIVRYG